MLHRLLYSNVVIPFLVSCSVNAIKGEQDVTYITSPIEMKSPGYPAGYENNLDLKTVITNPTGCITIVFLELSLENTVNPMIRCINDYLEIVEDQVKRKTRYCGDILPQHPYVSKTHTLNLTFHTDNNVSLRGYSTQLFFQQCFKYSWTKEKWSECSTTCGEGVMTRRPLCKSSSKLIVGPHNCNITKLPKFRKSCNLGPCPTPENSANQPNHQKTPIKRSKASDIDRDEPSSVGIYMSIILFAISASVFYFGFLGNQPSPENMAEKVDGMSKFPGNNRKQDDVSESHKKDE